MKIAIALIAALTAGSAAAQDMGDAAAGKLLADEYCARCHDIGPEGAFKQMPPSFAAIATYWGDDQVWNRIMFPVHTGMPAMWEFLAPDNVAHVTAYIRSLESE